MRHQRMWYIPRGRPKNIHRLLLKWVPHHHHHHRKIPPPVLVNGRNFLHSRSENSKDTLLTGELSDGRRGGKEAEVEVPKGFVAVYVGPTLQRFVIPTSFLSAPEFRVLMERAAEEYGFEQEGGLKIPCEEEDFEEILLSCLTKHQMVSKKKKKNIELR